MAVKNSLLNMVLCLGIITLVCAALLAGVNVLTEEPIARAKAQKETKAIEKVAPAFAFLEKKTAGDTEYYVAYAADSTVAGYVVNAVSSGFGGPIKMMVGFYADGRICNTSVLEHSETPGLGAKCTDPRFADQFKSFDPAVSQLKVRKDKGDVDAITASTITSRAYCAAIENAVAVYNAVAPAAAEPQDVVDLANETMEEQCNE